MAKRKLFLGPQLRRIRREEGLTQAAMASAIEVSPSYVNLMERNQRPVSADLLIRIATVFDLDITRLSDTSSDALFAGLNKALDDPLFSDLGLAREDAFELSSGNPMMAEAFIKLFRAYRTNTDELTEARAGGQVGETDPIEEARTFLHANKNYFPELEEAGEVIAAKLDEHFWEGMTERYKEKHLLKIRILPAGVMSGAFRRLNRHSREVLISEALDQASRNFHVALQLTLLEQGAMLDRIVNATKFETDAGRRIARASLANYAAGAIILPYERFLTSATDLRYDIEAIGRRFGASFEQVAHRLTTLQRPGQRGVSFFFLRVDAAGNISKRFSGDVFPFAKYGGSCPLWNLHETFRTPRHIFTQVIQLTDQSKYFSIARTVHGGAGGFGAPQAERAVALGCSLDDAKRLIYADGMDIETVPATQIGVTCRLCERQDCAARAHPPLRRKLIVDEFKRLAAPFSFEFD